MEKSRGHYSRGYLPHIDMPGRMQFLTWRLADAVPTFLIDQWYIELRGTLPEDQRKRALAARIEKYSDAGHGSCVLRDPTAARLVQESLFYNHLCRYELSAWCVMPNHVHALLTPWEGHPLKDIVRGIKSYSATRINRFRGVYGQLWQEDYFDRMIRDDEHERRVRGYIEWNPAKAKLCSDPARWIWSSACPDSMARLSMVAAERAN